MAYTKENQVNEGKGTSQGSDMPFWLNNHVFFFAPLVPLRVEKG